MYSVAVANVPALALAMSGDAILAGTTAAAYYSPEAGVLTVVARCTTFNALNISAMINGVELHSVTAYYPDIPANLGVWSGSYDLGSVPWRIPDMVTVSTPGLLHSMPVPVYRHFPATFRGGLLFLGDTVLLSPNVITLIGLSQ